MRIKLNTSSFLDWLLQYITLVWLQLTCDNLPNCADILLPNPDEDCMFQVSDLPQLWHPPPQSWWGLHVPGQWPPSALTSSSPILMRTGYCRSLTQQLWRIKSILYSITQGWRPNIYLGLFALHQKARHIKRDKFIFKEKHVSLVSITNSCSEQIRNK